MIMPMSRVLLVMREGGSVSVSAGLESLRVGDYASVAGERVDLVTRDAAKAALSEAPRALALVAVDLQPLGTTFLAF